MDRRAVVSEGEAGSVAVGGMAGATSISLFGELRITFDGNDVIARLPLRGSELLAYLLVRDRSFCEPATI